MRRIQEAVEGTSPAGAAARESIDRYLTQIGVTPAEVDEFVRKIVPDDHDIYFVSTIARGLAGPTSDIDLILVGQEFAVESGLTSMLFLGGRRLGLKTYRVSDVVAAFAGIEAIATAPFGERARTGPGNCPPPTCWTDLERLANGYSYTAGAPYSIYLPSLCRWSVARHALEYETASILAGIALAAGRPAAASGYLYECMFAALDLVMAAEGNVQANRKWTLERWDVLRRSGTAILAPIDTEIDGFASQLSDPARYADLVRKVLPRLRGQLAHWCPELDSSEFALSTCKGVHASSFLKNATGLSNASRSAVVSTVVLEDLLATRFSNRSQWAEAFPRTTAEVALVMLQTGLAELRRAEDE